MMNPVWIDLCAVY